MLSYIFLTAAALAATALADVPSARVAVEAQTGSGLQNTTITIPLNTIYKNTAILHDVSALYIIGAIDVPVSGLSCIPYFTASGSGKHAPAFSSRTPSHVASSADDQVSSIVCISMSILSAPPGGVNPSSTAAGGSRETSTTLVTHTPSSHRTTAGTGYTVSSQSGNSGPTGASASTPSATASQSAGNAASALYLSGEFFGGLALAGFGVAFAL